MAFVVCSFITLLITQSTWYVQLILSKKYNFSAPTNTNIVLFVL